MDDPYALLNLRREDRPSLDEIKVAFRKTVAPLHPDQGGVDRAAFQAVTTAYKLLSDPKAREAYDRLFEPASSVQDLFLRNFAQKRRMLEVLLPMPRAAKARGTDVAIIHKAPAKVLKNGGVVKIMATWTTPAAEVAVNVPPGDGSYRFCRIPELGRAGKNGGSSGDLILVVLSAET